MKLSWQYRTDEAQICCLGTGSWRPEAAWKPGFIVQNKEENLAPFLVNLFMRLSWQYLHNPKYAHQKKTRQPLKFWQPCLGSAFAQQSLSKIEHKAHLKIVLVRKKPLSKTLSKEFDLRLSHTIRWSKQLWIRSREPLIPATTATAKSSFGLSNTPSAFGPASATTKHSEIC